MVYHINTNTKTEPQQQILKVSYFRGVLSNNIDIIDTYTHANRHTHTQFSVSEILVAIHLE